MKTCQIRQMKNPEIDILLDGGAIFDFNPNLNLKRGTEVR